MRIADVMSSALDGIKYVVDLSEGEIDLHSYLGLPDGVEYVRAAGDAVHIDEQTLAVDLFGPDPRRHRPLERVAGVLESLDGARRAVLLLGYGDGDLPIHRIVDLLRGAPWRISTAVPLDYRHISTAIVLEPAEGNGNLAEHNLLRLTELGARALRLRLVAREGELERLRALLPRDTTDDLTTSLDQPRTEVEQLREELDELREDRRMLRELERSTTYQVGRLVVESFAKPGKGTLRAPVTLARMFKQRSERARYKTATDEEKPTKLPPLRPVRTHKLITPLPSPADENLTGVVTLAGVWSVEAERVLTPDARAVTLHPNQAVVQLWRADPDVLVVQSSAIGAGSPWDALGTSVGVARDQELRALLDGAERRDVPSVLWFDQPTHLTPGLDALADRFDLVLTDRGPLADDRSDNFSLGVQLARFATLQWPAPDARDPAPGFVGSLDPRLGLRRGAQLQALLDAAAAKGLRWYDDSAFDHLAGSLPDVRASLAPARAGYLQPARRPGAFRERAVWVATPNLAGGDALHARVMEQLAAGARVVTSDSITVPAALAAVLYDGSRDPTGALATALTAAPRDAASHFALLRTLHERASTQQWVARLARACRLGTDPRRAYATTLVVTGVEPANLGSVIDAVRAQRRRPDACVLQPAPTAGALDATGAIAALAADGIAAAVAEHHAVAATVAALPTRWCCVAPASGLTPTDLLDLHVTRACTGASIVAFGRDDGGRVEHHPALVRADLVANGTVTYRETRDGAWWEAPAALIAAFNRRSIGAV
jgi:hypothetical protein